MLAIFLPRTARAVGGPVSLDATSRREPVELSGSAMMTLLTVARLALVPVLISSFLVAPAITMAGLVFFVVADVYDGVLARRLECDGVNRRALDSMVDRLAIDSCLIGAYFAGALPLLLAAAFLGRDLYCAAICCYMVRQRKSVIKADWVHRSLNLSIAGWAIIAPFVSSQARVDLAAVLLMASIVVAVDLSRCVRSVISAPGHIRQCVVSASAARRRTF